MALSREELLKRGECCGLGCRNCPYDPRWTKGSKAIMTLSVLLGLIILTLIMMKFAPAKNLESPINYSAYPEQQPLASFTLPAKIVSIHDGDTITVEFSAQANIRLLDCWAPEITGQEKPEGIKSKEFLESLIKVDDNVIVEIPFDGKVGNSLTLSRILGKVYKDVDNDGNVDNISTLMTNKGFAKKNK